MARTLSFDCLLSIFANFSGSAGHNVGGFTLCTAHALYVPLPDFMSRSRTLCPAHEKKAGDLEIGQ